MGPNMAVSVVCETAVKCSSAIRDSLASSSPSANGNSSSLHSQILTSTKLALLGTIEYEESPPDFGNNVTETLKSKYTVLNANNPLSAVVNQQNTSTTTTMGSSASSTNGSGSATDSPLTTNGTSPNGPQIPTPKQVLYNRELVHIGWKDGRKWSVGTGMTNVGNTCYLNSTLQALFHVPSFANWLYSDDEHRNNCENMKCIICAMARTLKDTQDSQNQSIKPYFVYSKLREVCKHLVPGDQEDAHEFLRYLVEAMEKAYLLRHKNSKEFDQYTKETTPLNQILGGYLKSSVRCLSCEHVSVTFQHFQDLLLDIRKSSSIDEALDIHFARERLEDMGYKCESCKRKVSATKQFSMERPPITLCIQLKRFSMMGGKINKHISFSTRLNLSKYSAHRNGDDRQMIYRLVSVVTHLGSSQHCGHYTAVGLTQNGNYYNFDDSSVRQIPVQNVLQSNAYIIFYELEDPTAMAASKPSPKLNCTNISRVLDQKNGSAKQFIGPVLPPRTESNGNEPQINGTATTQKPLNPLVLNISQNNTTNKTWNNSKLVPIPTKINGLSTPTTPPSNVFLHQSTTGLTPDLSKKLKLTNGMQSSSIIVGTNHKKSDTNSSTATTTLNGKSSLPSMPKLDSNTVNSKAPTTTPSATTSHSKENSPRTPPSSPEETPAPPAATLHNKTNGTSKVINGFKNKNITPLVPYDDDSSDCAEEDTKSPPIVKTKAGLFHVTSTHRTNGAGNGNDTSSANSSLSTLSPTSPTGSTSNRSGVPFKRIAPRPADSDNNTTLSKLMMHSHNGFGAKVATWDGNASRMELELTAEKQEEAERKRKIDKDADMDRGRSKKIKSKQNSGGDSVNPGFNPFTEQQISININPRCSLQYQHVRNNFKQSTNGGYKRNHSNHRC